jgi:hypothetical protein
MNRCILESNLATTAVTYPFERGWLDRPSWLDLEQRVSAEALAGTQNCALIDAIEATKLFETHAILTDLALVSTHNGPIAMHSTERPDQIENAMVSLGSSGATAEAVARATIHHFYGIDVLDWSRGNLTGEVQVTDDESIFRVPENTYTEDLVRAWFIPTSLSLPTHLFVTPIQTLQQDPDAVRQMLNDLTRAVDVSNERRREVRRNLSDDFDIDRERLTDYLNDQKTRLTKSGRKGWLDLIQRVTRSMNLPSEVRPVVDSLSRQPE